jgi:D-alanyl-D-alanine carboxypeptidase (penicillin-binding protein 5/6)
MTPATPKTLATVAFLLAFSEPLLAQDAALPASPLPARPDSKLAELLTPLIAAHQGDVGVAIKHLGTGDSFSHRADEPMPTASLIKLPVMVAAYEKIAAGEATREKMIELKKDDMVPGSGILTNHFSPGTQLSFRDAIRLMIVFSDNTATNLVADTIGLATTTRSMARLGLDNTRLHAKVYRRDTSIDPPRSERFGLGSTTAGETIRLLEAIDRGDILGRELCDEMLAHLYACDDQEKLVRFLPKNVRVAHKSGYVSKARCDAGLIDGPKGRIAIAVLTENNADTSFSGQDDPSILIGNIAATTLRHFYPDAFRTESPTQGELAVGSVGPRVESLQRYLNQKLDPAPGLAVDGDFGPATEAAVVRLQRSIGVDATGKFDLATSQKLGPVDGIGLIDPALPDPAAMASTQPDPSILPDLDPDAPKTKELDASATPVVSARAWAIGDGTTGKILHGSDENLPLDNASTTKLMTAWLVAKLARQDPSVLEETLTFSERADTTEGSTADVAAGEKLRIGDLLYGLLLPSGNDAATALAEHFGTRLQILNASGNDPQSERNGNGNSNRNGNSNSHSRIKTPYDRFIDAMNAEAVAMGLTNTGYKNPHGLTADGHTSTAADLVKLAHASLSDPLIRKIVSTARHRGEITRPDGTKREAVWLNTNRLLAIEGYDGLKTGTTTAAGACLVASGVRGDQRLIVVVLGSSGSGARYSDARNLFRWGWHQLETKGKDEPKN